MTFDFNKLVNCLIVSGCNSDLANDWKIPIQNACEQYKIVTEEQVSMFLAQTGHESASFTHVVENLNYSAVALRNVFGRYFPTDEIANEYARNPEKIANRVYANRLGNGNEQSGEGWKFRGRGLIQITGKTNVGNFSRYQFDDMRLLDDPSPLEDKDLAAMSAAWFWWLSMLNDYADKLDIETCTKRINGGLNGIDDRKARWITIRASLGLS